MSNGIDFIIGGKDKAAPAFASTASGLKRLKAGAESLKTSTQALVAAMGPLLAVLAVVKTAMAAVGGVKAANEAYDAQTESVRKMTAALAARGASATASADMQDMAKQLEKLTGISDNVTIGLMSQAQAMGFATDKMDDAAKAAIGLAAATGKTADQSLGDLKAALEGNFQAFYALNPQIMYMRTNQEKLTAVMAIASQGMQAQTQDMNTVAGSGRRAQSAMSSLMESIGQMLAPIRVLINAGLQQLAASFSELLIPVVQYATEALKNIGPMMDWVKEKVVQGINIIVGAFTFFEVILLNLGDVWEMAKAYAEKAMLAIAGTVMHTLTVVIPEYAKWFGANFINLMKDAFNGVIVVVQNAGKIIGEMVYQIFAFIASGGKGGLSGLMADLGASASRSLTEGFKSSLTSLPEIVERQLTEREKDLADKIGAIGGRLGQEFSDKMEERMLGVGSTLTDEMSAATKGFDLKGRPNMMTQGINVTEGRLLTRGPGSSLTNKLDEVIRLLRNPPPPPAPKNRILVQIDPQQMQIWDDVKENTSKTLQMEAIA